jgi:hypothetical protein
MGYGKDPVEPRKQEMRIIRDPAELSGKKAVRIPAEFVRGMNDEDIKEVISRIQNCKFVRDLVSKVLTRRLDDAIIRAEDRTNLQSPNYVATLADTTGYRRGLREAIQLLTLEGEDQ